MSCSVRSRWKPCGSTGAGCSRRSGSSRAAAGTRARIASIPRRSGTLVRKPPSARASRKGAPAHAAALFRHPLARSRRGPAHHPDAARAPRSGRDHHLPAPVAASSQRHGQSAGFAGVVGHREERPAAGRIDESASTGGGRSHPRRGTDTALRLHRTWPLVESNLRFNRTKPQKDHAGALG